MCLKRHGWFSRSPSCCDEILVAYWSVLNDKLKHTVEQHAPATGAAPIKAEHELVQIVVHVGTVHGALVCARVNALGYEGLQRGAGRVDQRRHPASPEAPPGSPELYRNDGEDLLALGSATAQLRL